MVHVRFEGRSFDLARQGLALNGHDSDVKARPARHCDVCPERFSPYVVERWPKGDLIVCPEAVYG